MHKSDNNDNTNKDTSKMQYFAANEWLLMLVLTFTSDFKRGNKLDPKLKEIEQSTSQKYCYLSTQVHCQHYFGMYHKTIKYLNL